MCTTIVGAVKRGGYDGILLDLHGAMVTRSHEDGEGTLLSRIRAIDPTTPVAVAYDMHANVYREMVEHANVVDGEGTLLSRIRAIDPTTPVAVAYDMHANVYREMVE